MNDRRPNNNNRPREAEGLIYGIHPVMEAVLAGKVIEKAYMQSTLQGDTASELLMLFKQHKVPFVKVPVEKLNSFTRANHQGVVIITSPIEYVDIEALIPQLYEKGEVPFILVLDRITDVRNFGAIARTAECSGVHAIVIPEKGSASVTSDAMKTSAGALNKIPVCRPSNLFRSVEYLKKSGLQIVACTEKGSRLIYRNRLDGPIAVIMGSEEDGVSDQLLKLADAKVKIPMMGDIGSLNVSVAAGILSYEIVRQRIGIGVDSE